MDTPAATPAAPTDATPTAAVLALLPAIPRAAPGGPRQWALRTFLICALLLVLLPIVLASSWFFYRSALRGTEEFAQQLGNEMSGRVREKIISFFDVPQRVVTFNVDQGRAGYLKHHDHDALMRQFLLQIGQQPQLTFISMGLTDGQYFAGSRPPLGEDRDLRMLRARIADGRVMEVFRVDETTRQASVISRSDIHFDARKRPWYEAAIATGRIGWYGPYSYRINDAQGAYAAIGMGVSAPVRDGHGHLLGVVTADVALSQVNDFLHTVAAESGGVAFLADASGQLLATSTADPSFSRGAGPDTHWVRVEESADPILRTVGALIRDSAQPEGNHFVKVGRKRHLARWWTHPLANGPVLTMGVVLPESKFDTPLRGVLSNIVYLTVAVMMAAIFFAAWVANRVVLPLAALNQRAKQLTQGHWDATAPTASRVGEVTALSNAMDYMAGHLQAHAQQLETLVAQRTTALEDALSDIEQTVTEQRHFIAMLSHEIRSPLAVIHTAAQLLAFRTADTPALRPVVERILRGSTRLQYFFDNCLTQDRIDSQDFTLAPSPVDVASLVGWVEDAGSHLSTQHPLQVALQPGLPPLHGDPLLLRIMLVNLLSNAFKYSPAGEPVSLRIGREGAHCVFTVEDGGSGVPEEEAALIFQKYRRGRGAEGKPGAGLGLALVQRIASLHGGHVRLARNEPKGSRFVIQIPFQTPPTA